MGINHDNSEMTDDELLDALGAGSDSSGDQNDITVLRHVRSSTERRAAEVVAEHKPCADFEQFQTMFAQVESDLQSSRRVTSRFGRYTAIHNGDYFILGGQIVYVAEVDTTIKAPDGIDDARLRVIYANCTECNLLLRSLQRALYKDNCGRRISSLA